VVFYVPIGILIAGCKREHSVVLLFYEVVYFGNIFGGFLNIFYGEVVLCMTMVVYQFMITTITSSLP